MTKWMIMSITCLLFGAVVSEFLEVYDFEIDSEGHVMEGYLFTDLRFGDRVNVNLGEGETPKENGRDVKYIRLMVRKSKNNVNPPSFVVLDTEHFSVNREDYIVVDTNDTARLKQEKEVRFYVVLINDQGQAVSNPLPFIIRIEKAIEQDNSSDYSLHSAVFAGVLVLIIVLLALGIPFVVRAKRRYKQGKPVMKLGSHPGSSPDLKSADYVTYSVEDIPGMTRQSSEPNWYGENKILSYEQEVKTEKVAFTREIKQLERKISHGHSKSATQDDGDGLVKYTKNHHKGILKNGDSTTNENGHVSVKVDVCGPSSEEHSRL